MPIYMSKPKDLDKKELTMEEKLKFIEDFLTEKRECQESLDRMHEIYELKSDTASAVKLSELLSFYENKGCEVELLKIDGEYSVDAEVTVHIRNELEFNYEDFDYFYRMFKEPFVFSSIDAHPRDSEIKIVFTVHAIGVYKRREKGQ